MPQMPTLPPKWWPRSAVKFHFPCYFLNAKFLLSKAKQAGGLFRCPKNPGELLAVTHVSLFAAAHKVMSRRCYLAGAVSAKKINIHTTGSVCTIPYAEV